MRIMVVHIMLETGLLKYTNQASGDCNCTLPLKLVSNGRKEHSPVDVQFIYINKKIEKNNK